MSKILRIMLVFALQIKAHPMPKPGHKNFFGPPLSEQAPDPNIPQKWQN